ncbi:MAG: ABC transporter ATP-binding protein [Clostridium sp.]
MRLRLENILVKFKKIIAVNNLSIDIEDGSLVSFLGPSGCGKSSILFSIAGFNNNYLGNIYFDEVNINNTQTEKRNIGMVFQNYALYPHMSVFKNIEFPLKMKKINKKDRENMINDIADLVRIKDLLYRKPGELSGGQQQRVAIARALVKKPDLLLLDEPFSNLDARLRVEMREEVRRIQRELKITTIFVTHDHKEALSISDKVALLNNGELIQYGESKKIYTNPNTVFAAKFIGNPSINIINGNVDTGSLYIFDNILKLDIKELGYDKIDDGLYDIGIRGEDFVVCKDNGHIRGQVIDNENVGKDIILNIKVKNEVIRCITPYDSLDSDSNNINLNIKVNHIHIFDKNTGESVGSRYEG